MIFKSLNNQNLTKNNTGSLYTRTKCSRIKKPYTLDLFVEAFLIHYSQQCECFAENMMYRQFVL